MSEQRPSDAQKDVTTEHVMALLDEEPSPHAKEWARYIEAIPSIREKVIAGLIQQIHALRLEKQRTGHPQVTAEDSRIANQQRTPEAQATTIEPVEYCEVCDQKHPVVTAPTSYRICVYECRACSAKTGTPTLCGPCLEARKRAGPLWRGPVPRPTQAVNIAICDACGGSGAKTYSVSEVTMHLCANCVPNPCPTKAAPSPFDTGTSAESMGVRVVEGLGIHEGEWRVLGPWRLEKSDAEADARRVACTDYPVISVQPEWCRRLPLQQQSVLFLAGRGPDGVEKYHACKPVHVAYRATIFLAGKYGRLLEWGERADSFMSLDVFADDAKWKDAVDGFFRAWDTLPAHYVKHFMHGAQILGFKHPDARFRERWSALYLRFVEEFHLAPESEEQMDRRLGDWAREHWDQRSETATPEKDQGHE